jgi:hypothetical protein
VELDNTKRKAHRLEEKHEDCTARIKEVEKEGDICKRQNEELSERVVEYERIIREGLGQKRGGGVDWRASGSVRMGGSWGEERMDEHGTSDNITLKEGD